MWGFNDQTCHTFIPSEFVANKQMYWARYCDLDEL